MTSVLPSLDSVANGVAGNEPSPELDAPPHADANVAATKSHATVDRIVEPRFYGSRPGGASMPPCDTLTQPRLDNGFPLGSARRGKMSRAYSRGGYLCSLRWSERRWIPRRLA